MNMTIDRKVCEYTFWCCKQIPVDLNLLCFNLHQFAVCYTVYCGFLLQDIYHYETIHIIENIQHNFSSWCYSKFVVLRWRRYMPLFTKLLGFRLEIMALSQFVQENRLLFHIGWTRPCRYWNTSALFLVFIDMAPSVESQLIMDQTKTHFLCYIEHVKS
jgi:hypothetical protein